MTEGYLACYEFQIFGIIPATHTEVVIDNNSFGFSEDGLEIDSQTNLDGQYGYKLINSIPLGRTYKTQQEIRQIVRRLDQTWTADEYNIMTRNCRHFSLALINELEFDSTAEVILTRVFILSVNLVPCKRYLNG